jgi:hypothetical protein
VDCTAARDVGAGVTQPQPDGDGSLPAHMRNCAFHELRDLVSLKGHSKSQSPKISYLDPSLINEGGYFAVKGTVLHGRWKHSLRRLRLMQSASALTSVFGHHSLQLEVGSLTPFLTSDQSVTCRTCRSISSISPSWALVKSGFSAYSRANKTLIFCVP